MSASLSAIALACLAFALVPGCGSDRPLVSDGSYGSGGAAGAGGSANTFESDAGSIAPPGCGTKADGTTCDCVDAPLFINPPTIYFVLDRSGSMGTPVDKWTQVRVTVGNIMRALGPRAKFGASMFPTPSASNQCVPGKEIMSVRAGDPPSSGVDGPTTSLLLNATLVAPGGGTPTAATLNAVATTLGKVAGQRFVILATDGAPNCNAGASCTFQECQPNIEDINGCPPAGPSCCDPPDGFRENCNDVQSTITQIGALRGAGINVYVVGLPGAAPYATVLDQMAVAGGTAQATSPKYFAVDSASQPLLLATLKKIAAQITGTCEFDLQNAPADPSLVNVYMDDVVLPFEPVNGWTISGKTVTLVGTACDRVKSGDVLDVRIIAGCPRVEPK